MGFNTVRAYLRPRASIGVRTAFTLGAVFLGVAGLGAAADAQNAPALAKASTQKSVENAAIVVVGRARAVGPNVFGTVAVPFGTTPVSARWTRVMTASINDPTLVRRTAAARGLAPYQQAAFVQSMVNRSVHGHSAAHCGADDGYWAAAKETLARGIGDCIDIAITKMEALRQLGFAGSDLYLVTGRKFSGGLEAGLLVRIGEQFWFLDARSDQIVEAGRMATFTPVVTYGTGMTWAHGVPVHTVSRSVTIARTNAATAQPAVASALASASPPVAVQAVQQTNGSQTLGTGLDEDVKASIRALAPSK